MIKLLKIMLLNEELFLCIDFNCSVVSIIEIDVSLLCFIVLLLAVLLMGFWFV